MGWLDDCRHAVGDCDCDLKDLAAENETTRRLEAKFLRLRKDYNAMMMRYEAQAAEQTKQILADSARVAALEAALRGFAKWQHGGWHNLMETWEECRKYPCADVRAALARPTPTPDQRQYGKTCAHDGYVVAGCRDCEARATTPTPGEGEQG